MTCLQNAPVATETQRQDTRGIMSNKNDALLSSISYQQPTTITDSPSPAILKRQRQRANMRTGNSKSSGSKVRLSRPTKRQRTKSAEQILNEQGFYDAVNDLSRLIPLGTIDVCNKILPRLPAPGLPAPDGWSWMDPPWQATIRASLVEPLSILAFLHDRNYLRVTYKLLPKSRHAKQQDVDDDGNKVRLRIYVIPDDVEGRRFFPVMQPLVKKRVKQVLSLINTSAMAWLASHDGGGNGVTEFKPVLAKVQKMPTLLDMFNRITTVQSHEHDHDAALMSDREIADLFAQVKTGKVDGMRSALYNYQRETVIAMIRKELVPEYIVDPCLKQVTIAGASGNTITTAYMDTDTFRFRLQPSYYEGSFGGVLSEEMGFGKTCICIALICATKYQGSSVPERYRVEPEAACRAAGVQSLSAIAARTVNQHGLPWRKYEAGLSGTCVRKLVATAEYVITTTTIMTTLQRRQRAAKKTTAKQLRIKLTSTTLVVCPNALLDQWRRELEKHVETGFLRVLVLDGTTTMRGDSENTRHDEFGMYDVVVMTQRRLVTETARVDGEVNTTHWKRVIVDEGHSMGSGNTSSVVSIKNLYVERRWAVTGTPVPGLMGVNVGLLDGAMTSTSASKSTAMATNLASDLARLGHIVSDFLLLKPWHANPGFFQKYCSGPFIDGTSYEIIERVLRQVMVRHGWRDLERDVQLPKLIHNVIMLAPTRFNRINIDLFHAVVAVNSVSSDRTDQDYLFHKSNRAQLRRLVTNLMHMTFHWTGFTVEDVEFMIEIATNCVNRLKLKLESAQEQNVETGMAAARSDVELLERSIKAGREALADETWMTLSRSHEMGYVVASAVDGESGSGGGGGGGGGGGDDVVNGLCVVKPDRIATGPAIVQFQHQVRACKELDVDGQVSDAKIADMLRSGQQRQQQQQKSSFTFSSPESLSMMRVRADSMYRHACTIMGSVSSKLSYLVSRLQQHVAHGEKSIVFYEFTDVAYFLGEGLEIAGIGHCFYTTTLSAAARARNLAEFNGTGFGANPMVMIMDLGLAAHGLNVTGASRVFFVNPVWQPHIEAQAMRRAHRIGQARPVVVETLVLRDTIEQAMFDRRRAMTEAEFAAAKTAVDDAGMSAVIQQQQGGGGDGGGDVSRAYYAIEPGLKMLGE
ncbi:P-loop containing nucleoside triphosphate hydrolase protein [Lipomyces japonicus]|uniref:P-loop containing nucleoside triphosphate hydrolase protein n=1 Tax=Lipomyces japonicus TaxID=56871 RepID=UPI0034CFF885